MLKVIVPQIDEIDFTEKLGRAASVKDSNKMSLLGDPFMNQAQMDDITHERRESENLYDNLADFTNRESKIEPL